MPRLYTHVLGYTDSGTIRVGYRRLEAFPKPQADSSAKLNGTKGLGTTSDQTLKKMTSYSDPGTTPRKQGL